MLIVRREGRCTFSPLFHWREPLRPGGSIKMAPPAPPTAATPIRALSASAPADGAPAGAAGGDGRPASNAGSGADVSAREEMDESVDAPFEVAVPTVDGGGLLLQFLTHVPLLQLPSARPPPPSAPPRSDMAFVRAAAGARRASNGGDALRDRSEIEVRAHASTRVSCGRARSGCRSLVLTTRMRVGAAGPIARDGVRGDGGSVRGDGSSVRGDGGSVRGDGGSVRGDGGSVRGDGGSVRGDGGSVRGDGGSVRGDGGSVRGDASSVRGRDMRCMRDARGVCACAPHPVRVRVRSRLRVVVSHLLAPLHAVEALRRVGADSGACGALF
jgi:hypothetical protein